MSVDVVTTIFLLFGNSTDAIPCASQNFSPSYNLRLAQHEYIILSLSLLQLQKNEMD